MSVQAVAAPGPARSRLWVGAGCALLVILALLAIAVMAPLIAPYSPETQNLLGRLKPPGFASRGRVYWLGSDELGRDLLSRLVWGARVSLLVATASVLLSAVVGTILGMVAGYRRGAVEVVLMRIVDVFLSIPAILFAIILVAVLGPGLTNVVVVLALNSLAAPCPGGLRTDACGFGTAVCSPSEIHGRWNGSGASVARLAEHSRCSRSRDDA